jgi:YVTN family beta-propeller protein
MHDLVFLDLTSNGVRQSLPLPRNGDGFSVVGLLIEEDRIYATDAQENIRVARKDDDGTYYWGSAVRLEKPRMGDQADPAGMARLSESELFVTTTRGNNVQVVNRQRGTVTQVIDVGVAPYTVVVARPDRAYVSNWGGDPPSAGDPQKPTSGTLLHIDPRTGIADRGSVSVLGREAGAWKQIKTIRVGLHPSGMTLSATGKFLYVANANSDTVSVIDTSTDAVVETIACRPEARLPFGSGSNAVALGPDGGTLYVANGTNNCVAVVRLAAGCSEGPAADRPARSEIAGLIPTGWYPGALRLTPDGKRLVVANVKGIGALARRRPAEKGRNSHDHLGSVSLIDLPDAAALAAYTRLVNENNRLAYSLAGLDKPRLDARPVPVPRRHGEPSLIQHVIYIIKENRTYDQVFGDMKEGNGDPRLCIFGEEVTPNHHKLAREFTLFDNFYCSGVLSADGHAWADAAYVTDYLEKAFGSFTRSYPDDGRDPLAFAPTGFLWDNALAHKKTVRNYGESVSEKEYAPPGTTWKDYYDDYKQGVRRTKITLEFNHKALEPLSHPTYPYFPLLVPDVYRAELFLEDLRSFEKRGTMPHLTVMSLPCDHTEGTTPDFPTPRAMVADNDLALGRIVEAVSRSRFWKQTCILVVEDDPQNGYDHVDGHRTVALAISPYTRRRFVDHTNYNQTGMVKTIELMLGLPPMNQMDLSATPMRNCFQETPDLTPYTAVVNRVALDEMNPPLRNLKGKALYWAQKSLALNLRQGDRADEDTLNRILWHATRGYEVPYPEQYTGGGDDD